MSSKRSTATLNTSVTCRFPSLHNMIQLTLLSLCLSSLGTLVPASAGDQEPIYLRGVPPELREKILAFHRVLNTPDNFITPAPPDPKPSRVGFGLAEVSMDDTTSQAGSDKDAGELQSDLFRFSNKVTVPHTMHSMVPDLSDRQNFVNFIERKEKIRQRIQIEWKRFIKWRAHKRKKRSLKRRIMRTLNHRLKIQFGRVNITGKRTKEELKAFKRRKRILKRKIKRRLKQKQRISGLRKLPGRASLPEHRLKMKTRNGRMGQRQRLKEKLNKRPPRTSWTTLSSTSPPKSQ